MSRNAFDYELESTTITSSTNLSPVQTAGYDYALLLFDVTSLDTADADESYEVKIQGHEPISDTWYDIVSTGTFTSTGLKKLLIGPALAETANESVSTVLPSEIRVRVVLSGTTPSITYTARLELS